MGLEFVSIQVECEQIGDTVLADAGFEQTRVVDQGIENGVTTRAAPGDDQPFGIRQPLFVQGMRAASCVFNIHFAPALTQGFAVSASVASAAAVVYLDVGITTRGEVGGFAVKAVIGDGGRAAVDVDQGWRRAGGGAGGMGRWIIQPVDGHPTGRGPGDFFGSGQVGRVVGGGG